MNNLRFIRNQVCHDYWDFFEVKTDVWIFGDKPGYRHFQARIADAITSNQNIVVKRGSPEDNSMGAIILPAQKTGSHSPKMKAVERLVWWNCRPQMELIIVGNKAGYERLMDGIDSLYKDAGDLTQHFHLDDVSCAYMVPRSIALNFRAPVDKWEGSEFGEYSEMVAKQSDLFIPKEVGYRLKLIQGYEDICSPYSGHFSLEY
jgi:hypothetical protein